MSPAKYQDSEVTTKGGMINGQRLSINKESHMIQKSSSSINENTKQTKRQQQQQQQQQQPPVIIYTHTPKVIHAQACDFMVLVQKLTGMSKSDTEKPAKSEIEAVKEEEDSFSGDQKDCGLKNVGYGENEASSALMNEMKENSSFNSPFFATNSDDIFCSPRFNSFIQPPSSFLDYNM
ncbi:hypothetical protein ACS0TY_033296 [Phlomoides rotata]